MEKYFEDFVLFKVIHVNSNKLVQVIYRSYINLQIVAPTDPIP